MAALSKRAPRVAAAAAVCLALFAGAVAAAGAVRRRSGKGSRAYRLRRSETLPKGIARIARGRIDNAADELGGKTDSSPEEAVHEARKDMKKLRALLRLARGEIGDETYRAENARLRDAGRRLSGVRDADVLLATFEKLEGVPASLSAAMRSAVQDHRATLEREGGGREAAAREAVAALDEARAGVKDWSLERKGFGAIEDGLRNVYRRGRRALRAAEKDPDDEALHEFRKRAKDLWYHLTILRPAWPGALEAVSDEAHALSERLGDDHDLAVLGEFAHERLAGLDLEPVDRAIAARRAELQADAFALGERLYAEPPKAFTRRMRGYYRAWRAESPH
jgi:CHAD domain-containing protein